MFVRFARGTRCLSVGYAGSSANHARRTAIGVLMATMEAGLTAAIVRLASAYGRYGYRRITALLRGEGWHVNHKRVERIWRREGLKVPAKQPKRGRLWINDGSCIRLRAAWPNHVWSYDFVMDRTHDGRAFRMLIRPALWMGFSRISPSHSPCQD